jgi:hypothetical protein
MQDLVDMVGNLRDDMLSNLRDNACRWACSLGRVGGSPMAPAPAARGEDDGPGIARSDHEEVLLRGRRLEESRVRKGLGSLSCAIWQNSTAARPS